jgi:hypothetical protein
MRTRWTCSWSIPHGAARASGIRTAFSSAALPAAAWLALLPAMVAGCSDEDESSATQGGSTDASESGTSGTTTTTATSSDGTTSDATTTGSETDATTGTSGTDTDDPDNRPVPPRPSFGRWLKVELPGLLCGNGSQYKFFVNYVEDSEDLLVVFEPGGACWDYESCTGKGGIRGAANINGIPDNHMATWGIHTPLLVRDSPLNPVPDVNMVFMPYCTADVHTGNRTVVYSDPDGVEPDVEFHHNGHANVMAAIEWMDVQFPKIDRLMVTGCSAGGAGTQVNYFWLRKGLNADRGFMLNDSGPVFPMSVNSAPLHAKIRESWDVDSVLALDPTFEGLTDDFGLINTRLADEFPDDRLAITYFLRDYNYSLYSYERFYDFPPKDEIHRLWAEDTALLTAQYDQYDNLGYYIPYWRSFNDSHCTLIGFSWSGTEIQEDSMDLGTYLDEWLDDSTPLMSYQESPQSGEDGTP